MKAKVLFTISWFAFALLGGCASAPQALPPPPAPPEPAIHHTIALVLGGGAARGFAHIGVIKALESQGIRPDIVVGTSAGSVVGALYAAGHSGFDLQKISMKMDEGKIGDWTLSARGFVKGEFLQDFVNREVGNLPIEKLQKPFAAVATDLQTGESVAFRYGNTGMAVRASSSVPGIFQPVGIRGREYVDGGLTSPVPVETARKMGADIVIAVDVSSRPRYAKVGDTIDILLQTFNIMEQSITRFETASADILIRPAVGKMGPADFEERDSAIMEGERAGLAAVPLIRARLARP